MKAMITVIGIASAMLFTACKKSDQDRTTNNTTPQTNCDNVDSRFAAKVFPIIQNSCATIGCHSAGSPNGPGPLTNYSQIKNASIAIRSAVLSGLMPKNTSLSADEKNIISCWVSSGAPDN